MNGEFVKKIIELRGDAGKKWLGDLPKIIKHYEENWKTREYLRKLMSKMQKY